MKRSLFASVGLLALLSLRPAPVVAQSELTDDELKCQIGQTKTIGTFIASKAKCVIKCEVGARKGKNPPVDCRPPFAGATAQCVAAVEQKATDGLVKVCAKDCPECLGDCSSTGAAIVVMGDEQNVDGFVPLVYCNDSESGDGLTKDEAKCQDTVAKAVSKFVGAKQKCYASCRAAERKGSIPAGSCAPPAADAKTQTCITAVETKVGAAIDKKCATAGNNPECVGSGFDTGAEWLAPVEALIDGGQPNVYCGSSSGAFLDLRKSP